MKGVDGTTKGWIAAEFNGETWELEFLESLEELSGPALVDIPIGLPQNSVRKCDALAREFLSPQRHYSVFNCPVREAVYSESYEQACKLNEEQTGKRISKQAWNICSKIREADKAFRNGVNIKESHPEVIFKQLDDSSVENSKSTKEGLQDRKQVLERLGSLPDMENLTSSSVSEDDILDALVLAYAATQPLESLPENPKTDSEGIEMKIMKLDRRI